ncbi:calcium/calmodulin dependent protein kinase [Histoplasma capsulatum]|uniref:Calcium/calmodulin dependent protein kinase n=1 Tax=Ajellomyces capsulatus TaxID=5037 RepID=A0A8A1M2X2_AJECA|nr:calcium/calmodulin dependent protein kinase [Histoplasma capsulatum]
MSGAAFSSVLLHPRLSGTRRTGCTLYSGLLFRNLLCPITFSAPVHTNMDIQQTLTGVPEQSATRIASVGTRIKDALRGLRELHDRDIVHTAITRVQLADIEDSAIVPPNCDILGKAVGNWMWRSPEAHAEARVNKPSDIFSFGIVWMQRNFLNAVNVQAIVLQRQLSYFGNDESVAALLKHIGDERFDETTPHEPFALWKGVDPVFKDLITGLTNLDLKRRLTAQGALKHPWFQGTED